MKKVIKVTPGQLQKLIQEEAVRQKRVLDLKKKRTEIINQLNEMYDNDEYVDEGVRDFFLGGRDKWKEKFMAWMQQNMINHPDAGITMPEGQDLEDAVTAAQKSGDFRVVKRGGKWVPTHFVSTDAAGTFDGSGRA